MKNILVIDDSALMRRIICDIINSDSRFYVKDTAADGIIALKLLENNVYDAVILDINMPNMNGIEFLKELRSRKITQRIMIFSTDTSKGAAITIEALELGALDFIQKPAHMTDSKKKQFRELFLQILASVVTVPLERIQIKGSAITKDVTRKTAAPISGTESGNYRKTEVIHSKTQDKTKDTAQNNTKKSFKNTKDNSDSSKKYVGKNSQELGTDNIKKATKDISKEAIKDIKKGTAKDIKEETKDISEKNSKAAKNKNKPMDLSPSDKLVVIACSTGGPKALQRVIPFLPDNLDAPVLVVQHMPSGFTATLAERLDMISSISCSEAKDKETIHRGHVYIAAGGKHLKYSEKPGQSVYYSDEPPREGVKPCANYLFESLINSNFNEIVCVVMTGMGADGTQGIVNLNKHKKLHIIAQDEHTCTVYGMPKCITDTGLVNQITDLDHIAQEIILKVGVK